MPFWLAKSQRNHYINWDWIDWLLIYPVDVYQLIGCWYTQLINIIGFSSPDGGCWFPRDGRGPRFFFPMAIADIFVLIVLICTGAARRIPLNPGGKNVITNDWLVVWLPCFYFPIYWECHHPNWLSYFSEGWPNHQPDEFNHGKTYRKKGGSSQQRPKSKNREFSAILHRSTGRSWSVQNIEASTFRDGFAAIRHQIQPDFDLFGYQNLGTQQFFFRTSATSYAGWWFGCHVFCLSIFTNKIIGRLKMSHVYMDVTCVHGCHMCAKTFTTE